MYYPRVCKIPCLVFLILAGTGSVLAAAEKPDKGTPCKLATGGDPLASPVDDACKQGGVPAAKAKMKELVRDARKAGTKFECDDCHKTDADYSKLVDGAQDKFKKLLAALPKKP